MFGRVSSIARNHASSIGDGGLIRTVCPDPDWTHPSVRDTGAFERQGKPGERQKACKECDRARIVVAWRFVAGRIPIRTRGRDGPGTSVRRGSTFPVDDSTLGQIIGRKLNPDLVSGHDTNKMLAHSASHVSQNFVTGFQFNLEPRIGQCLHNGSFNFKRIVFCHKFS
jgi:hypothetical protein